MADDAEPRALSVAFGGNSLPLESEAQSRAVVFSGIERLEEFCTVSRTHVIAWRKKLECKGSGVGVYSKQALSSLGSLLIPLRTKRHHAQLGSGRGPSQLPG